MGCWRPASLLMVLRFKVPKPIDIERDGLSSAEGAAGYGVS